MAIAWRVLGEAGRDNAVLMTVDRGQGASRCLFDCGEACVASLALAERRDLDEVFFSHLHMDHVAGFDTLFRANLFRSHPRNRLWGPPGTAEILHHRFRGYLWNLHRGMPDIPWWIVDIDDVELQTWRFQLGEAFEVAHDEGRVRRDEALLALPDATVTALSLDHHTPSMAYLVRERSHRNLDVARLEALGLKPGPWLAQLKDPTVPGETELELADRRFSWQELRDQLLVERRGDAVAYCTDFGLDAPTLDRLVPFLEGCTTLICEGHYRHVDLELARQHRHLTTVQAAELAAAAGVGELVLFHLSDRYRRDEWQAMLDEARAIFPATSCPKAWRLG